MTEKDDKFGDLHSQDLEVGDIVQWSKWNSEENDWNYHLGIILEIKNEIKGNRMVSTSRVMPLNTPQNELNFFTMSLKLISKAKN